jgi:hypothetical protein
MMDDERALAAGVQIDAALHAAIVERHARLLVVEHARHRRSPPTISVVIN